VRGAAKPDILHFNKIAGIGVMWRHVLAGFAAVVTVTSANAETDCRIHALPPPWYADKPLPPVEYKGLPLADLQRLYRKFAGLPKRASGLDYCADPLGFVYPWGADTVPTIYYPTDVSERCRREVIAHEEAHVKGWPLNHPNGRLQNGPCKSRRR
jgi:hypothetical protein